MKLESVKLEDQIEGSNASETIYGNRVVKLTKNVSVFEEEEGGRVEDGDSFDVSSFSLGVSVYS